MPKFAANLSLLFTEYPYADRFAAAAKAGFEAVEVLFPYAEIDATLAGLSAQGQELVLINAPLPNPAAGHLGLAATPGAEQEFRNEMSGLLEHAIRLKPGQMHIMSGNGAGQAALDTFMSNLEWLLETAPNQRFTLEPLNPRDRPDYFLNDYDLAAEILDRIGSERLGLQYDTYHSALIHGDALEVWQKHGQRATHVQIGNPPNRSEPGPGDVDFPTFFAELDASGYGGWVSAEYNPTRQTEETLAWMA
ncbi:MAG: hydroxypyruvate isomerase family protein [Paracoccaceae bacterium]